MKIKHLHDWNLPYDQAVKLQLQLAKKVKLSHLKKHIRLVAGLDCAFSRDKKTICAVILVLKMPRLEIIETVAAHAPVQFPYIPGLLSFREAPVCIKAAQKLKFNPDLFLVDGQGLAHPRSLGLATHLGLFFDKPTIGCAKSRLTGTYSEPPPQKGSFTPLKLKSRTIGAVLRTRTNVKPLFISIGNKCLLKDAIRMTLACTTKCRLPEPTRLAHQMVSKLKTKI